MSEQLGSPDARWFYAQGKQRMGPVALSRLRELLVAGEIDPTTMVLKEGTQHWIPAQEVGELTAPDTRKTIGPASSQESDWTPEITGDDFTPENDLKVFDEAAAVDLPPRRRGTILETETPITDLKVVLDLTQQVGELLRTTKGQEHQPHEALQAFLRDNRQLWEASLVESAGRLFSEYFASSVGPGSVRPSLAVRITDSYQGSWVIEAAVVLLATASAAHSFLKHVSEIPSIFEGLGKIKDRLQSAYTKLVNHGANQRIAALAGTQMASGNIVAVQQMIVDPRPVLRLSNAPEKRSAVNLAAAISRHALSLDNMSDRDLHYVRLGVFKGDSRMYEYDYAKSYMGTVSCIPANQRAVRQLSFFVDEAGRELALPPGKDTYVACWVSDADNITVFQLFLESGFG